MNWSTWANEAQVVSLVGAVIVGMWRFYRSWDKRMSRLESNFKPNGGTSLRDAIDRIDNKTDRIDKDLANLTGRFTEHIRSSDEQKG